MKDNTANFTVIIIIIIIIAPLCITRFNL